MARSRNLKPGFFKNEDLAECSLAARLCFAGLWTLADREGRLEDRPKRIRAELFAFDLFDVSPLLAELEAHGFILRYEADGRGYIQVLEFNKHQQPHYKEPKSTIPAPQSPGLPPQPSTPKPRVSVPIIGDRTQGNDAKDQPSIEHRTQGNGGKDPRLIEPEAPDKPRSLMPTHQLDRGSNRADSLSLDSLSLDCSFSEREKTSIKTDHKNAPKRRGSNGTVHGFPPGFERFWSAYPRKVGKDAAAKAFAKRKPDTPMVDAMVVAVEAQKRGEQWVKDGGQFIPHPSTWLNEGRWQDGPAGPAAPDPDAWKDSRSAVINRGCTLGFGPWDLYAAEARTGPSWEQYRRRVIEADSAQQPSRQGSA